MDINISTYIPVLFVMKYIKTYLPERKKPVECRILHLSSWRFPGVHATGSSFGLDRFAHWTVSHTNWASISDRPDDVPVNDSVPTSCTTLLHMLEKSHALTTENWRGQICNRFAKMCANYILVEFRKITSGQIWIHILHRHVTTQVTLPLTAVG